MKILHLAIIGISALIITMCIQDARADNGTTYYNQLQNPPLGFTSIQGTSISVTAKEGSSTEVPILIKLGKGYAMESITQVMLTGEPGGVQGWIGPDVIDDSIDKANVMNGTLYIYVDSDTQPGTYIIKIVGRGAIKELATGKDIQVMNPSAANATSYPLEQNPGNLQEYWKEEALQSGILGSFSLVVEKNQSKLSMSTGSMAESYNEFCSYEGDGNGKSCLGFITHQEIPLTITSPAQTQVHLEITQLPNGGWVEIVPKTVEVGPEGATATIMMAGAERPPGINPSVTHAMEVRAISEDGSEAAVFVPMRVAQNVTVLHSPGPILFGTTVPINSNQKQNAVFGTVYDPQDNSKQIRVSLSVLGFVNGTTVGPLPKWLSVEIPNSTFTLDALKPYYFMIYPKTSSAPEGKFSVAIGEEVGGEHFVENINLDDFNMYFGGAIASSASSTGPSESFPAQQPIAGGSWSSLACFGAIVGAGATAISVYVMRKK